MNLFPKVQEGIYDKSTSSIVLTALASLAMIILVGLEIQEFLSPGEIADLVVEPHRAGDLVVHLDMELTHVPCHFVKITTDSVLQELQEVEVTRWTDQFTFKDIQENFDGEDWQGCRLTGGTRLAKLP